MTTPAPGLRQAALLVVRPPRRLGGLAAAVARHVLWTIALWATGGCRADGSLPARPCVIVANHSSHADTPALLAVLPPRRRPAVAAAADYWFAGPASLRWRAAVCTSLTAAFPVRRSGGGSADLASAGALIAAGRDVIVFPEGTRSRDGSVGSFHSGAARLADAAGAPIVPVGIRGTGALLPVHGRLRRTRVIVRIGAPVTDMAAAQAAVARLAEPVGTHRRRHPLRGSG
jgi:1-acyl-sn-glycerol-3-phosphate acyltransferase